MTAVQNKVYADNRGGSLESGIIENFDFQGFSVSFFCIFASSVYTVSHTEGAVLFFKNKLTSTQSTIFCDGDC